MSVSAESLNHLQSSSDSSSSSSSSSSLSSSSSSNSEQVNPNPLVVADSKFVMDDVFSSLKANQATGLNLSDRALGDAEIIALAKCLEENTSLNNLILANNLIGDEGTKALATALTKNTSVQVLILFKNKIGNEGAKALSDMFGKRTTAFAYCVFGENPFDHEHSSLIYQTLLKYHPTYVANFLNIFVEQFIPQLAHFSTLGGIKGDALLHKFTTDPNQFLEFVHPNPEDESAHMLGDYSYLSECHCISYFSRDTNLDCRKMVEDMLVSHYGNQNINEDVFRYVSISSSDFFQDIVNIAKLAQSGKRGRHFEVVLIDDYKYPDHTVVVKQIPRADVAFQFMAFLYRMGIQVKKNTIASHTALLIEQHGFELFERILPEKIENPLATVTLTFFDSIEAYKTFLESTSALPHVILDVDSLVTQEKIDMLKTQAKDATLYLSLAKTHSTQSELKDAKSKAEAADFKAKVEAADVKSQSEIADDKSKSNITDNQSNTLNKKLYTAVKIKAETKKEGQWIPGKVLTFNFNYENERRLKDDLRKFAKSNSKPNPFA